MMYSSGSIADEAFVQKSPIWIKLQYSWPYLEPLSDDRGSGGLEKMLWLLLCRKVQLNMAQTFH